jgi:hypothetical protein
MASTRRAAAFAALVFGGAWFIAGYNRLGYTYNLLLFWSAVALVCAMQWARGRRLAWLAAATAAAALGLLTDQVGIFLPAFVAIQALPSRRRAMLVLAIGVAPAAIAALAFYVVDPIAAAADWRQSLARAGGVQDSTTAAALAASIARWFANYLHLLRSEWWWPVAIVGLFSIRPLAAQRTALTLFGLMVIPIFMLRELDPFFRTGIPLFLPGAWGSGALLDRGVDAVYRVASGAGRRASAAAVALVVVLPLGLEIGRSAGAVLVGYRLPIEWALATHHDAARAAAAYVNARTHPGDVVIVSPHIAWLFDGRVADFLQAIAADGRAIAFYPASMAPSRFRFDP